VILFRPEHVQPILDGRKTQTRRLGDKRWNVGATHQLTTRLFDPAAVFARALIRDVRRELLHDLTSEAALAEGYADRAAFFVAFHAINRTTPKDNPLVWVVEFEVMAK
jgi:hypothetical protein